MSPATVAIVEHRRARRARDRRQAKSRGLPRRCVDCRRVFWTTQVDDRPLCGPCWRRRPVTVVVAAP